MKRSEAFPSPYLSQEDVVGGPIRATIADVRIETIKSRGGEQEKPIMKFREPGLKSFVVNRTCWKVIEKAYGEESGGWAGKPIELYHDPGVMLGDEQVGGIRVRIPEGVAPGEVWTWEKVLAEARKANLSEDQMKEALKAKGLKGYTPSKDTAAVMSILSAEAAAEENTIPF